MATTNYDVNYEDERFSMVENDKQTALSDLEQTYAGMIGETDKYYQDQIDAAQKWADTQSQLQQEQTDFTIEQIEQQKAQAQKDYTKEQSGAYVDWQKQSNQYGVEAEQMAAAGLAGTGFSESSQVSMYNTYQNRVATAREVYNQAVLNYNNAIKDARLQNNSLLAEIAYEALQTQLKLSLEGFQYKNNLVLEQANKKIELERDYYNRYLDVLNQINTENALAEDIRQFDLNYEQVQKQFEEEIRQYNQTYELQLKQFDEEIRQYNQNYELQMKQFEESIRQFNEELERLKAKDAMDHSAEMARISVQMAQVELERQALEEEKRQYDESMKLQKEQLEEEQRQFNAQMYQKTVASQNSSSSGSTKTTSGGSTITSNNSNTFTTEYFSGTIPSATAADAENFGTFSNGYQPKGIAGHGALSKSGDTVTFQTETLSGKKQTVTQSVWKAADGTLWYWEGREMKYKQFINSSAWDEGGGGTTFGTNNGTRQTSVSTKPTPASSFYL